MKVAFKDCFFDVEENVALSSETPQPDVSPGHNVVQALKKISKFGKVCLWVKLD